jgi:hypothetical protein
MNILIENAETLEFLTANGQWTKKPGKGSCFETTGSAFEVAKREPIGMFNIVQFFALNNQLVNLDHGSGKGQAARVVPHLNRRQGAAA